MDCVVQVINMKTGERSEACRADRGVFASKLRSFFVDDRNPEDYGVLVLMDMASGEWAFSSAPFLMCSRFIELFGDECHGREVLFPTA